MNSSAPTEKCSRPEIETNNVSFYAQEAIKMHRAYQQHIRSYQYKHTDS